MEPNPKNSTDPKVNKWALANLGFELGYVIALPLVALALAGKWLDHKVGNHTQWFTILGILIAITLTTIWLTKKLRKYIK